MIVLYKTPKRMKELIKTMREPTLKAITSNTEDYIVLKNARGVVEYRFKGNYKECADLFYELTKIKEQNGDAF